MIRVLMIGLVILLVMAVVVAVVVARKWNQRRSDTGGYFFATFCQYSRKLQRPLSLQDHCTRTWG